MPQPDRRQGKFTDFLSSLVNSLAGQGQIVQTGPQSYSLEPYAAEVRVLPSLAQPATETARGILWMDNNGGLHFLSPSGTDTPMAPANTATLIIGEAITNATPGSVLWADSNKELAQNNANFFWDQTNKRLGVQAGTSLGTALFQAGHGGTQNSVNTAFLDLQTLDATATAGNHHSFSSCPVITSTSLTGFCSFDARYNANPTVATDHFNCYQAYPTIGGTGNVTTVGLFVTSPTLSGSGTTSAVYHFSVGEVQGAGDFNSQYGLYVSELTKANVNNYAIWTQGATKSRFNGIVQFQSDLQVNGSGNLVMAVGVTLGWGNSGVPDTMLTRGSASVIAQANGMTPQTFRIFNSDDGAGNWEFGDLTWSGNAFTMKARVLGTGTPRAVNLVAEGIAAVGFGVNNILRWQVDTTAKFAPLFDNSLDIGTTTDRVRTIQLGTSVTFNAGGNIVTDTSTGTKIATGATQKLSFWGATTIAQPAAITAPSGGATIDAEARTAINSILAVLSAASGGTGLTA